MGNLKPVTMLLLLLVATTVTTAIRVPHDIECTRDTMVVRVPAAENDFQAVEVDKWGFIEDCQAFRTPTHYILTLPLDDISCGTIRIRNKLSGKTTYHTRIAITTTSSERLVVPIKCSSDPQDNIVKRDVLPPEFVEPDIIEITSEVTGTAPIPILNVGVRQNGQLVGGQINVRPGTPLTMEVFLDDSSADIYGILMNYMEVTDTANKRETIIFNGCSVDPILFDNFITTTGDFVSAKFRAFKFPETNYVLFRGTVDVCLDKCQGIACSNGQLGYGRRRRGIDDDVPDPNKIFEVTMMTFLKVEEPFNSTTAEERLEEEVNRVAEDVKAVERALEEVKEVAEERIREEKIRESAVMPWGRPAMVSVVGEEKEDSYRSSEGKEPVYIYYNSAVTSPLSVVLLWVTAAAALLAIRV